MSRIIEISFEGRDHTAYRGMGEISLSIFYKKDGGVITKLGSETDGWYGPEPNADGGNFPGGSHKGSEGNIPPKADVTMRYYDTHHLQSMPEWVFKAPGIEISEGDENRLNEFAEEIELETHLSFDSMRDYLDSLCEITERVDA